MVYQTLRIREQPGVCFVQLYRPEAQNAINRTLSQELLSVLTMLEEDMSVNVMVLEGLPDLFCSGMDFQEYIIDGNGNEETHMADAFALLRRLTESSKVIVAKVEGKVTAGGMGFVAASDFVVAKDAATFALSELLFGLLPAVVLPFLCRRISYQRAKLLALSTQPIAAAEAYHWGLIDAYGDDPDSLLRPYLQRWRRLSPQLTRQLKTYMNQLQPIDRVTQTLAVHTIAERMVQPTVKQGIRRYVEEGVVPWLR